METPYIISWTKYLKAKWYLWRAERKIVAAEKLENNLKRATTKILSLTAQARAYNKKSEDLLEQMRI